MFCIGRSLYILFLITPIALANPEGEKVVAGDAQVVHNKSKTIITQKQNSIIEWNSFNVNAGEVTQFRQQPGGVTLNRIDPSNGVSEIMGNLRANGGVFLINPAGIMFGPESRVDVGSIVATTANISNENFLSGKYHFEQDAANIAQIINKGRIKVAQEGVAALLGAHVVNEGRIIGKCSQIRLGAGDKFVVDFTGDEFLVFALDQNKAYLIEQKGKIIAKGGHVLLSSPDDVLDSVINMEGKIHADTIEQKEGFVRLSSSTINTSIKSLVSVSTPKGSGKGGRIEFYPSRSGKLLGRVNIHGKNEGGYAKIYQGGWYSDFRFSRLRTGFQRGTINYDPKFLLVALTGDNYDAGVNNLFANNAAGTTTIAVSSINNSSANVVLEANTDFTLNHAITMNHIGTTITIKAGRSVLLNNAITTLSGKVTIVANSQEADTSNRDSGAGNVTISGLSPIIVGLADIDISVGADGTGANAHFVAGDIDLRSLEALSINLATPKAVNSNYNITLTTNMTVDVGADSVLNGIVFNGSLNKRGIGQLTLSNSNQWNNTINVEAGTVRINHVDALKNASNVIVSDGATLKIDSVSVSDLLTLSLTGLGFSNAGALQGTGSAAYAGPISLDGAAPVAIGVDSGSQFTISGQISSGSTDATLIKEGAGNLILTSESSNYPGATILRNGTTTVEKIGNAGNNSSLGAPGNLQAEIQMGITDTATLVYNNTSDDNSSNRPILIQANGAIINIANSNRTLTLSNTISGTNGGGFEKTGPGTLELNATNTYNGSTSIDNGTLATRVASALPSGTALTIESSGILDLRGNHQQIAKLVGTGNIRSSDSLTTSIFTVGDDSDFTFSGTLGFEPGFANIALTKVGVGKLILDNVNPFDQNTTVLQGSLEAANNSALGNASGSGSISVSDGASLILSFASGGLINTNSIKLTGNGNGGIGALVLNVASLSLSNQLRLTGPTKVTGNAVGGKSFTASVIKDASATSNTDLTYDLTTGGNLISFPAIILEDNSNLDVTTDGAIVQTGAFTVPGNSSFNMGNNSLTLDQANVFTGAVSVENNGANAVLLKNTIATKLGRWKVGSTFEIDTGGNLSQDSAIEATGGQGTFTPSQSGLEFILTSDNQFGSNMPIFNNGSNLKNLKLRNISTDAVSPEFDSFTNLEIADIQNPNSSVLMNSLTVSLGATVTGKNVSNSENKLVNVNSLTLSVPSSGGTQRIVDGWGSVDGKRGNEAIDVITITNGVDGPGTHFWDGIDMFRSSPNPNSGTGDDLNLITAQEVSNVSSNLLYFPRLEDRFPDTLRAYEDFKLDLFNSEFLPSGLELGTE